MQAFSCSVCTCVDAEAGPVLGAAAPSTGMGSETCAPRRHGTSRGNKHSNNGKRKKYIDRALTCMIDRFTSQLGSNVSAQIDRTSGGSADQFIDADQCRYARQHLLHIHTVIISTRTEASRFFFYFFLQQLQIF